MEGPRAPVILGAPRLLRHIPSIDWAKNTILDWSPSCLSLCLHSARAHSYHHVTEEDFPDLSNVPSKYSGLRQVFSKTHASSLPPHRPYDCFIDLTPSESPEA